MARADPRRVTGPASRIKDNAVRAHAARARKLTCCPDHGSKHVAPVATLRGPPVRSAGPLAGRWRDDGAGDRHIGDGVRPRRRPLDLGRLRARRSRGDRPRQPALVGPRGAGVPGRARRLPRGRGRDGDFVWGPEGLREADAGLLGDAATGRPTCSRSGCGAAPVLALAGRRRARGSSALDLSAGMLRRGRARATGRRRRPRRWSRPTPAPALRRRDASTWPAPPTARCRSSPTRPDHGRGGPRAAARRPVGRSR